MERKHWIGYAATAVVALGIGGAAAGSDSSSSDTETKTVTETVAASAKASKVRTRTVTVTAEAETTAAAAPVADESASSGKTLRFSGDGAKKLKPFTVDEGSTLKWTNTGDIFSAITDDAAIGINSQAKSGSTYVEPGTYTLDINALGSWTIKITPGS